MKRPFLNIILWSILTALSIGFVSCGKSNPDTKPAPEETVVLFRVVSSGQMKTKSAPRPDDKTSWGVGYNSDAGDNFDNKLLKEGFKVIITNNDCSTVLSTVTLFDFLENDNGVYSFLGIIPPDDVDNLKTYTDAKLHVIANAGYRDIQTRTDFETWDFTKSGKAADVTAIPMWGVGTVDLTKLVKGETLDAGTIVMLRSMAKVEIQVSTAEGNLIEGLKSAVVTGANTQGFLLPGNWSEVENTNGITFEQTMHEKSLSKSDITINAVNAKSMIFYLPETENTDGKVSISLTYTVSGKERSNDIHFAEYNNGTVNNGSHYDITRNHHYRFVINFKQAEDAEIEIQYTVCPMTELKADIPEFS